MGKDKKEKRKSENGEDDSNAKDIWNEKLRHLSSISQPLASRKLTKKLFKTLKKATAIKNVRKGVREVQKFVRKGEKGFLVLAGDISPVDVISHMPITCEEAGIPYCYVPSKEDLGGACGSKRQICMVLVKEHEDYQDLYEECYSSVKEMPLPL